MSAEQGTSPAQSIPLVDAIHSQSPEIFTAAASDPALTEDLALTLLKRADLPAAALEILSRNASVIKLRKIRFRLVTHPQTPRHISLPALRHLYTFEVMQVALTPIVPADVKRAADEVLLNRLETISSGEKLSLARRASGRIAAKLLLDKEARVMQTALENSRLTEPGIVKALALPDAPPAFIDAVCHHPKWSLRREVRVALLRHEKTPLARALEFARSLPAALLREVLQNSRLPAQTKAYLIRECRNAERNYATREILDQPIDNPRNPHAI
jgi:hypothetical protein